MTDFTKRFRGNHRNRKLVKRVGVAAGTVSAEPAERLEQRRHVLRRDVPARVADGECVYQHYRYATRRDRLGRQVS